MVRRKVNLQYNGRMKTKALGLVVIVLVIGVGIAMRLLPSEVHEQKQKQETAQQKVVRGKQRLREQKYNEAISEFTDAIRLGTEEKNPDENPYLFRSIAYKRMGDEAGADTDLAKANEQIGALQLEAWMEIHKGER
jgi:Tfp pilus assembly protein PilF